MSENHEDLNSFLASHKEEPDADAIMPADSTSTSDAAASLRDHILKGSSEESVQVELEGDVTGSDLEDEARNAELGEGIPDLPEPLPTIPKDPVTNHNPIQDALDDFNKLFEVPLDDTLGTIEVTDNEKEAYLRSMLHDTPLFFKAELTHVGVTVVARIPTSKEFDAIRAATAELIHRKDNSYGNSLTAMQAMYIYTQIYSVNDREPFAYDYEKVRTHKELVTELTNPDILEGVLGISAAAWWLYCDALRVVEAKINVCHKNLYSRDFFVGAGTATS